MAQPTEYDRQYNFTNYQATAPTTPLPAAQVDLELNSIKITLDEIMANLALIQRGDGEVANQTIGNDQLKPEITIGFNPPATWATATVYNVRDYVFVGSIMYRCLIDHTSGVFATDLAAVKWVEVARFAGNTVAAIDLVTMAANQSIYFTSATVAAAYSLTAQGRALAALSSTGLVVVTGSSTASVRSIAGTANEITSTNGDGVAGNPTISLPAAITLTGKTLTGGTFSGPTLTSPVIAGATITTATGTGALVLAADPALTGNPTAPTQTLGNNSTRIANTAFVQLTVAAATSGVPSIDSLAGTFITDASIDSAGNVLRALFRGQIYGLGISNNVSDATNDIDIAVGEASDASTGILLVLGSALTKRLDAAWAVGTNQGGLDTGSIANTTYHLWLIERSDTGVKDVLFSASATSPTMPTNYDRKAYIMPIVRAGAAIRPFTQSGNQVLWMVPVNDVAEASDGDTAAHLTTLSVPTGIQVIAHVNGYSTYGSGTSWNLLTSPDQTDSVPSITLFDGLVGTSFAFALFSKDVRTNTSAQIRRRQSHASASWNIMTKGFTVPL